MARPVRGCPTPWSQQVGTKEPETNVSVPQQVGQEDTISGKAIADYNLDITTNQRDWILTSKQSIRKRKSLMQNMQKWSYLKLGHCIRGR